VPICKTGKVSRFFQMIIHELEIILNKTGCLLQERRHQHLWQDVVRNRLQKNVFDLQACIPVQECSLASIGDTCSDSNLEEINQKMPTHIRD
jgi:hypothetical protein